MSTEATDPVEEKAEVPDDVDLDDVPPPPEDDATEEVKESEEKESEEEAPEEEAAEEEAPEEGAPEEDAPEEEVPEEKPFDEGEAAAEEPAEEPEPEVPKDDTPDFSQYKTNVAERLWRAKKAAEDIEITTSPDLIKRAKQYQEWRMKMAVLNKCLRDYSSAMKTVSEKRNELFKQYALMSADTPLWDHVGKPLTDEQTAEVEETADLTTMEGIEARTNAIMKVAEEIGSGSLMSHQQLAMMQEQLNDIDFKSHTMNYISEWEEVVTSQLDDDVKEVRELAKKRDHYIVKVDALRASINKIHKKKTKETPSKKLTDQLERNEKKLADADAAYEAAAHKVSIVLNEATARGWVDFYPVIKNVMKFEINRLGRESSCYGSYHSTLKSLKVDYKTATQGTPDAPAAGSAL